VPILDLGYRSWQGERTSQWGRWYVVAATGVSLVWRGVWLRRLLMLTFAPALFAGGGFFIAEQGLQRPTTQRAAAEFITEVMGAPELGGRLLQVPLQDPQGVRHDIWAHLLLWFFRYPQAVLMVVVVGVVAPRLISYDLRSRGYLLYFSRPLSPAEYVLGKSAVLWFLLAMITMVPALLVYLVGVGLSPELTVMAYTWDLPLRIIGATAVLAIPTTALALCYSSLTTESRYAGFAWFATWVLGWVTYAVLTSTGFEGPSDPSALLARWRLVSPYHTLGLLQSAAFGIETDSREFVMAVIISAIVSLLGYGITYRQITKALAE